MKVVLSPALPSSPFFSRAACVLCCVRSTSALRTLPVPHCAVPACRLQAGLCRGPCVDGLCGFIRLQRQRDCYARLAWQTTRFCTRRACRLIPAAHASLRPLTPLDTAVLTPFRAFCWFARLLPSAAGPAHAASAALVPGGICLSFRRGIPGGFCASAFSPARCHLFPAAPRTAPPRRRHRGAACASRLATNMIFCLPLVLPGWTAFCLRYGSTFYGGLWFGAYAVPAFSVRSRVRWFYAACCWRSAAGVSGITSRCYDALRLCLYSPCWRLLRREQI